jgi:hypothetical protein
MNLLLNGKCRAFFYFFIVHAADTSPSNYNMAIPGSLGKGKKPEISTLESFPVPLQKEITVCDNIIE